MKNGTITVLNKSELLGRQFTIYGTADQPLFLAKDVAEMVSVSNHRDLLSRIDDDEKVVGLTDTLGGNQQTTFLTEDGLYEVLMQSRKPVAKQFKKGVKAILKEIRTKGGYIATQPDESPEAIMAKALRIADETLQRREQQLQMAQSTIEEQETEIKSLTPLADYTKAVLQSTSTFTLTQVSKDLGFRSVHKFSEWAQKKGILYKQSGQWMPHSKYSGLGYFAIRTAKFVKQDNTIGTSKSTVITEKGIAYLHSLIDKETKKGGAL